VEGFLGFTGFEEVLWPKNALVSDDICYCLMGDLMHIMIVQFNAFEENLQGCQVNVGIN
jgi:hypothetical protein